MKKRKTGLQEISSFKLKCENMGKEITKEDITKLPWIESSLFLEEASSTNSFALELSGDELAALPMLIVARNQTAGRGRGENRWSSRAGSLTFSIVIDSGSISAEHRSKLAFTAALSVFRGLTGWIPNEADLQFKWPNDIYLQGKKLGGILIEGRNRHIVIGIGLNVNLEITTGYPELAKTAISLIDVHGQEICFHQLLAGILSGFEELFQLPADRIIPQWEKRSLLNDRIVTVKLPNLEITGRCLGVNCEGHLLLLTPIGIEEVIAGSIVQFE